MQKGTLVLTTNGGERKMNYSLVEGTYYMATRSATNKVDQIKADNNVSIDLNDKAYTAELVESNNVHYEEVKTIYLSTMGGFQRFLYKNMFGKKNDMFIILK